MFSLGLPRSRRQRPFCWEGPDRLGRAIYSSAFFLTSSQNRHKVSVLSSLLFFPRQALFDPG